MDVFNDFKQWPTNFALKNQSLPTLIPPYDLNNTIYTPQLCKDGDNALTGIQLINVGSSAPVVPATTPPTYTYDDVVVGNNALPSYRNLFDNLRCGIEAYQSSVDVRNSGFSLMHQYYYSGPYWSTGYWGGMGVYSYTDHTKTPYMTLLDTGGHSYILHFVKK